MKDEKEFRPRPVASDLLYDDTSVVSATECTGLGRILPRKEEQAESYKEIYDIPLESGDAKEEKSE